MTDDTLRETPSQTAGPYVHIGLAPRAAGFALEGSDPGHEIFSARVPGERVRIEGRVLDGAGTALSDVLIEVWQADGTGRHHDGTAEGWGRVVPDFDTGTWAFETVKPGAAPGSAPGSGPHIAIWIVARGINLGLHSRIYLDDAPDDPVLRAAGDRRATLIARPAGAGLYRHDIVLQGEKETVFLDV